MQLSTPTLDFTLVAALILAVVHVGGPRIRRALRQRAHLVASFGGGVAAAYVFLSLFPEIELAHDWLGDRVHLVTLASFLTFYGIELWIARQHAREDGPQAHTARAFWLHLALIWLYTWMVVFALPGESGESLAVAVLGSLAVGLHLIYKDYVLRASYREEYQDTGRILLALAPIAGWLAHQLIRPPEVAFDLFVAVMAGILMQGVFREEVPGIGAVRLRWLVGGALTFTTLALLT